MVDSLLYQIVKTDYSIQEAEPSPSRHRDDRIKIFGKHPFY